MTDEKLKIIVFEGLDKLGKTTLIKETLKNLESDELLSKSFRFKLLSFPDTKYPFLREIGKSGESSPYSVFLSHALSHSLTYEDIYKDAFLKKADGHDTTGKTLVVLCDRYWISSLAYSTAIFGIPSKFILDIEANKLNPPFIDLLVYFYCDSLYPNFYKPEMADTSFQDNLSDSVRLRIKRSYESVVLSYLSRNKINWEYFDVEEYNIVGGAAYLSSLIRRNLSSDPSLSWSNF